MRKAEKITLVLIVIAIFYLSSIFIINAFVKESVITEYISALIFVVFLSGLFIFFGHLIIKKETYIRSQKIFLILFLIIVGVIDVILIIIAIVSGLWIYYPIIGIFTCISLAAFSSIISVIELRISKKKAFSKL